MEGRLRDSFVFVEHQADVLVTFLVKLLDLLRKRCRLSIHLPLIMHDAPDVRTSEDSQQAFGFQISASFVKIFPVHPQIPLK